MSGNCPNHGLTAEAHCDEIEKMLEEVPGDFCEGEGDAPRKAVERLRLAYEEAIEERESVDTGRRPITHVAIRWDERIWSLPKPFRHHHVIETISRLTGATSIDCRDDNGDQGFLDASGRYLTRKQALVSAMTNEQLKDENDIRLGMLFSEDVW